MHERLALLVEDRDHPWLQKGAEVHVLQARVAVQLSGAHDDVLDDEQRLRSARPQEPDRVRPREELPRRELIAVDFDLDPVGMFPCEKPRGSGEGGPCDHDAHG